MVKVGRPKIEFTPEQIEQIDEYALINCKDNQIATLMGIASTTFKQHFGERCRQKRAEGQATKMQQQYDDKTPTMLIWWGKQHLEQTDKQKHEHGVTPETAELLGMIDGSSKGRLPDTAEDENAGQ